MRSVRAAALTGVLLLAFQGAPSAGTALLPDLQTVVPKHLQIQNERQREMLRFSNGIANRGAGDWRVRPLNQPVDETEVTVAVQEILDEQGAVVHEHHASTFEFHPEHNHWHIGDVALFEVRPALDDGRGGAWGDPYVNDRGEAQSLKVTFCLIDWYKLDDNAPTHERKYWDCAGSHQGIQPGWVDQYHQSTGGQEIDITGAPAGVYYLVSTANSSQAFLESDYRNNSAWVSFQLARDSKGNPKIHLIAHSACDTPGMCGEQKVNR